MEEFTRIDPLWLTRFCQPRIDDGQFLFRHVYRLFLVQEMCTLV